LSEKSKNRKKKGGNMVKENKYTGENWKIGNEQLKCIQTEGVYQCDRSQYQDK
jgi:hypothetical protein